MNNKKTNFVINCLALILVGSLLLVGFLNQKAKICFDNKCFDVEVAKTQKEKADGLAFRKSLAEDSGMLFVFDEEGPYSFWMKNTLIPLDIIWIDGNSEVVFIQKSAQPCAEEKPCQSITPDVKAKYVWEVNSGFAEKIGLRVGDKLNF